MVIDRFSDGHVHTSLCRHASGTMEEYVLAALSAGLKEIIFLEHLEEGINYHERTWLTEEDFDVYFSEGHRLQDRYGGKIAIGLGVEVGYNPECADRINERLAKRQWSQIGLSFHYARMEGISHHLNLLSRKKQNIELFKQLDAQKLLNRYFDTLIEAVGTVPATVLCHLDAGLRHLPGLTLSTYNFEQIARLLDRVKAHGMALEINTSGFPLRDRPFPGPEVINLAVDRGIPLVAGSDAHRPIETARHFDRLHQLTP